MAKSYVISPRTVHKFMESVFGENQLTVNETTDERIAELATQLKGYGIPSDTVDKAAEWVKQDRERMLGHVQTSPDDLLAALFWVPARNGVSLSNS